MQPKCIGIHRKKSKANILTVKKLKQHNRRKRDSYNLIAQKPVAKQKNKVRNKRIRYKQNNITTHRKYVIHEYLIYIVHHIK